MSADEFRTLLNMSRNGGSYPATFGRQDYFTELSKHGWVELSTSGLSEFWSLTKAGYRAIAKYASDSAAKAS